MPPENVSPPSIKVTPGAARLANVGKISFSPIEVKLNKLGASQVLIGRHGRRLRRALDDSLLAPSGNPYYTLSQTWVSTNGSTLSSDISQIADVKKLEDNVRGFAESSQVLMKVLDEVAKVHPFIGSMSKVSRVATTP